MLIKEVKNNRQDFHLAPFNTHDSSCTKKKKLMTPQIFHHLTANFEFLKWSHINVYFGGKSHA